MGILDLIGKMPPEAFKLLGGLLTAIINGDSVKAERAARAAAQAAAGRAATLAAAKAARAALKR
ncbi:MAG TPA: hypothetical protein VJN18_32710 [Polyangiaceae bacterium]|nr:hypothetical protein [Polyangiaceae bacterium]